MSLDLYMQNACPIAKSHYCLNVVQLGSVVTHQLRHPSGPHLASICQMVKGNGTRAFFQLRKPKRIIETNGTAKGVGQEENSKYRDGARGELQIQMQSYV